MNATKEANNGIILIIVIFIILSVTLNYKPHTKNGANTLEHSYGILLGGAQLQFAKNEDCPGAQFANMDDFPQVLLAIQHGLALVMYYKFATKLKTGEI